MRYRVRCWACAAQTGDPTLARYDQDSDRRPMICGRCGSPYVIVRKLVSKKKARAS